MGKLHRELVMRVSYDAKNGGHPDSTAADGNRVSDPLVRSTLSEPTRLSCCQSNAESGRWKK